MLARPEGGNSAAVEAPDRPFAPAAPVATEAASPPLPIAASGLARGHSVARPWGGRDGIPADALANGARIGGGLRRRLGGRARRKRTRFRRHAAAVADFEGTLGTPPRGGKVLPFSLHNYRIVASLCLNKVSLVAFSVVVDTEAGPNLVRRNALSSDWLRHVGTAKEAEQVRLRDANNTRIRTSGTVTL